MATTFLDRIQQGILARRAGLARWFGSTSELRKQTLLGPASDEDVQAQLRVLDEALEQCERHGIGCCQVCGGNVEEALLLMDYAASVCLDHFSAAERLQLENELEMAQRVQRAFLPEEPPQIPNLALAAFSRPAQIIGGDYFDFLHFPGDVLGLAIADVAGHGMAASLHMASVQTLLRTLVATGDDPASVIRHAHDLFIRNTTFTTFVSVFLAAFDASKNSLTYSNAGHNPPLRYRASGRRAQQICWLQPTGPAVGLIEGIEFGQETIELEPDDILVLYTDGVTEATNQQQEQFGQGRLATLVAERAELPPEQLLGAIRQALQKFTEGAGLDDDATIVVGKVLAQ